MHNITYITKLIFHSSEPALNSPSEPSPTAWNSIPLHIRQLTETVIFK